MRRFVDLHLRPSQDAMNVERMARQAAEMGFHVVGLSFDASISEEGRAVARLFGEKGLETALRIDLRPRHRNELLASIKRVRPRFDIVAVECHTKQVASLAFRDSRVDLVRFPADRLRQRVGKLVPRRLKKTVEFSIHDLLVGNFAVGRSLYRASHLIRDVQKKRLPVVVSSGATDWLMMRAPKDMAAIVSTLGLESAQALDAISDTPFSLVRENLEKRKSGFISDGIRTVRLGA